MMNDYRDVKKNEMTNGNLSIIIIVLFFNKKNINNIIKF